MQRRLLDMEKPDARLQRPKQDEIKMIKDMFDNLYQDIGKLEKKFEDLLYTNSQNDLEDDFGHQGDPIEVKKPEELLEDPENTSEVPKFEKIGLKYYYIDHTTKVNWSEAYYKCRKLGGDLAVLENKEELLALSEKLTKNNYWLNWTECVNLKKINGESNWSYRTRSPSSYVMNYDECKSKFNFICEKDNIEEGQD